MNKDPQIAGLFFAISKKMKSSEFWESFLNDLDQVFNM